MKRIDPSYCNLLILVSLLFITINQTGCSKKSDEITPINKMFITKKKTFLYEDVHARNVIAEIPEFTTLKAKRKMTVQRSSGMVAVYYDVQFNKQHGWAMAIYLAEVSDDEQPRDSRKRKPPKKESNGKPITPRSNKMKPKITKRTQNSVQPSRKTESDHRKMREKAPVAKNQQSISDGTTSLSNVHQLFSVQVGSFKDSIYAMNLANNIRSLGFDTQLNEFYGNSGLWWRVRVGKYNSREKRSTGVSKLYLLTSLIFFGIPNNSKFKERSWDSRFSNISSSNVPSFLHSKFAYLIDSVLCNSLIFLKISLCRKT